MPVAVCYCGPIDEGEQLLRRCGVSATGGQRTAEPYAGLRALVDAGVPLRSTPLPKWAGA